MLPMQKAPQKNLSLVADFPLLQTVGASVSAATTYTRTHKHSKGVTRHVKPNPRATRAFYLIHT